MIENSVITASDILKMQNRLAAYLTTYLPTVNLQTGSVMYDMVIRSMAHVLVLVENEALEMQSRYNIESLATKEDITSRLMLDDVLSNWFIQRKSGGLSTVTIDIEVSTPIRLTIDSTYIFTRAEGISFSPSDTFSRTYELDAFVPVVNADGVTTYRISVLGISNNPGLVSSLPPGSFNINKPIPGFIKAYSNKTSSTVTATETNYQLLQRAKDSLSSRGMTTPKAIKATINDLELANVSSIEVVRSGDSEMHRDLLDSTYGLFSSFHTLGKSDVVVSLEKALFDTAQANTDSNFKVKLIKDSTNVAVYSVLNVRSSGTSLIGVSYKPFTTTSGTTKYLKTSRSVDDSTGRISYSFSTTSSNSLNAGEYRVIYGDYKTTRSTTAEEIYIEFSEAKTNISIEYIAANNLNVIEDLCSNSDMVPVGIDLKALLPSVVEVKISKLKYNPNLNSPIQATPETLIRNSLANYITNFVGTLSVSDIASYVSNNFYQFISGVQSDILVEYVLHAPDGYCYVYDTNTVKTLSVTAIDNLKQVQDSLFPSATVATVEYLNSIGVSNRLVAYYCDSNNIQLEQQ